MLRRVILIAIAVAVLAIALIAGAAYWLFAGDGFRLALESQASTWLGQRVRIEAARARFFPRIAIQLTNIRVGEPVRLALDDVELGADLIPMLRGRIEDADVRVSGSQIDMPLPFSRSPRTPARDATTSSAPVRIVSVRSIALRSVRLRSRGRELVVSADSALDGTTLTLERFSAEAGGTTLEAQGVVRLSPRIDARLNARANRLDLDELIALADAFSPPSAGEGASQTQPALIVASITAEQGTAGGVHVRNLATELTLDGDSIALNQSRFEVFGGRYEGSLTAQLGQRLSATLDSHVTDLDVAQLADFGGAAGTVTGRLSGAGTFMGSGSDFAQLLHGLRGTASATITDGSIRRLNLVRTVILFFGRPAPDAGESTDRFERLDADFLLTSRVVRAHAFTLNSADADMVGEGTLNLDTDALDGRVDVTLSEALSMQAGTDLYRYAHEGKRVVLPAAIGGTLAMPRLTIDVAAAAKRGLRNEVERRIEGLLDGLKR
jgi:uncharacterized protein involved in outer membrane biogenesis